MRRRRILVVVALGALQTSSQAANFAYRELAATLAPAADVCEMPVTKAYQIKPNFCPMALVYMIPSAVGPDCCCGTGCGPYGIPPIYASGQNVMVRQTPAMQKRVKEFLTSLGALVEPKKRSY